MVIVPELCDFNLIHVNEKRRSVASLINSNAKQPALTVSNLTGTHVSGLVRHCFLVPMISPREHVNSPRKSAIEKEVTSAANV
jgi:hypothetical protein